MVMVAQPCEYTKTNWIVHFKVVNFMEYEYILVFKNLKLFSSLNWEKLGALVKVVIMEIEVEMDQFNWQNRTQYVLRYSGLKTGLK